jgi:hypothetical protein
MTLWSSAYAIYAQQADVVVEVAGDNGGGWSGESGNAM